MTEPELADDWLTIYGGDAREILAELAADSIDAIVTSPPYWGLRDYGTPPTIWGGDQDHEHAFGAERVAELQAPPGSAKQASIRGSTSVISRSSYCSCGAWRGALGLEPTPIEYVDHLVEIFAQLRRVLRPTGTAWLNIGDSYASGKGKAHNPGGGADSFGKARKAAGAHPLDRGNVSTLAAVGLKPKDLVGIPWRVALALQADGWHLRADVIWSKPNATPESVTDRPTKSHEYVFMLTKSARYYWDGVAVAEAALTKADRPSVARGGFNGKHDDDDSATDGAFRAIRTTRNIRSVWTIPTVAYPGAHYAVFPPALVAPAIKASTSARGHCPECGRPWERIIERGNSAHHHRAGCGHIPIDADDSTFYDRGAYGGFSSSARDTGQWRPTCNHQAERVDDLELLLSPIDKPATDAGDRYQARMSDGRAGLARPRTDAEGRYEIRRWQQRAYARLLRSSAHRAEMASDAGSAFAHYTRTDRSGARAIPLHLLELWIERGWLPALDELEAPPAGEPLEPVPAVVLDPFGGSGTTGMVAQQLSRRAILIDLKPAYLAQQLARNGTVPLGLELDQAATPTLDQLEIFE